MKTLRVLVLTHPELVPPSSLNGLTKEEAAVFQTEYDVVSGLKKLGHEVSVLGVQHDITSIRNAIDECGPHIAFNLLEGFYELRRYDSYVVAYLELLGVPYTGCHPRGLSLARDKALSKKVLSYHRLPIPRFQVFPRHRKAKRQKRLEFPLFVKPLFEEASTGISKASRVEDDEKLSERIDYVHKRLNSDALVEEFVPGREIYVSVLGNARLDVFPAWELCFDKTPADDANIATEKAKWDLGYQKKWGIKLRRANLPETQEKKLARIAKRIYRRLDLSGYARFDFRMNDAGDFYFLEANPNPDIGKQEAFAEAAKAAGYTYENTVQRILNLGLRR